VTLEDKANVFIPLLRHDRASGSCILDVDVCDVQNYINPLLHVAGSGEDCWRWWIVSDHEV